MALAVLGSAAALAAPSALAQGPPASVASPGFGGRFGGSSGVPASVTSLGFGTNGSTSRSRNPFFNEPKCCINPLFPIDSNPRSGHRRGFNRFPIATPVYVPYSPVVVVEGPVDDSLEQPPLQDQYLGGPTVFDRRGPGVTSRPEQARSMAPARDERELEPAPTHSEAAPAADQPETLLVFKDGHQLEVQNYAIVGETLYDMTPGHRRKVALAELDLEATTRENDDRGVDFRLPLRPVAN